ncbi:MAG: metallophosphoesterase, partial [Polaromonas sp.]
MFVATLLHVYLGARLVPGLAAYPLGQWLMLAGLVMSALVMPLGLMAHRVARPPLADVLSWLGLLF